ncbi:MAG: hypothetical protein KDI09_19280, partial [Halioglobus sp.]|nr:hypothetical protein [Halioglobus sp.]
DNPKALFYGGLAAVERGDQSLAADRWEALLALSPPPEVQDILRVRIAEWRGSPEPVAADVSLSIDVSLGAAALADVSPDTTVFVIARDPAQPAPPVAAARRKAGELPVTVTLSNSDAMIPGRLLSQFKKLEILVRASLDGQPVPQAGDWYGQTVIDTDETTSVDITIDRQVQ